MTVDLRKLAALRREATPGPWWTGLGDQKVYGSRPRTGPTELLTAATYDAAYIAAAGSLTGEELEALADVVARAAEWEKRVNHLSGRELADIEDDLADAVHVHAALDRQQETTP